MNLLHTKAQGRDNNLNLIRAIAAFAVLISHAVPIAAGPMLPEPLENLIGYSLGTVSVMMFFVISGFLIPLSFERAPSHQRFIKARVLRIFPGLTVNLVFVALILGPLVTTLPLWTYLSDPQSILFILRNIALVPLVYTLPGVFEGQPTSTIVGSIWTLRHEVGCYLMVFLLGLFGLYRHQSAFRILSLMYLIALWPALIISDITLHPLLLGFTKLSLPFVVGMGFYAWRQHLPLTLWGVAVTACAAWALSQTLFYYPALCLALGYATFWLSYIPSGAIRAYNQIGDYSYGIYVYAFPAQGWAVWAFGPQSPFENILYATIPTIVLAVASWHLVEKPAMGLLHRSRVVPS
jgi:peptidoglycan/LPS O-acetylase OafA/YrhL